MALINFLYYISMADNKCTICDDKCMKAEKIGQKIFYYDIGD